MPGAADGISSRQYSPSPSPAFLYPNLSLIDFLNSGTIGLRKLKFRILLGNLNLLIIL